MSIDAKTLLVEDQRRLIRLSGECIDWCHKLVQWGHGERKCTSTELTYIVQALLDAYDGVRKVFEPLRDAFAPYEDEGSDVAVFGVFGTSYCDATMELAESIMDDLVEALDAPLFVPRPGDDTPGRRSQVWPFGHLDVEQIDRMLDLAATDLPARLKKYGKDDPSRVKAAIKRSILQLAAAIEKGRKEQESVPPKKRWTKAEAERAVAEYCKKHPGAGRNEIAQQTTVPGVTVSRTDAYKEHKRHRVRESTRSGRKIPLSNVENVIGEGKKHELLEQLIGEQDNDYEPSPLDESGNNPIVNEWDA